MLKLLDSYRWFFLMSKTLSVWWHKVLHCMPGVISELLVVWGTLDCPTSPCLCVWQCVCVLSLFLSLSGLLENFYFILLYFSFTIYPCILFLPPPTPLPPEDFHLKKIVLSLKLHMVMFWSGVLFMPKLTGPITDL